MGCRQEACCPTTDASGQLTARYAYEPTGKRRNPDGTADDANANALRGDWSAVVNSGTDRGFTGHEYLDDIGLVHMNGRLFDLGGSGEWPDRWHAQWGNPVVRTAEAIGMADQHGPK